MMYSAVVCAAGAPHLINMPATLTECEGGSCDHGIQGSWTFDGSDGVARWTNFGGANLTIERFDSEAVVIRRVDMPRTIGAGIVGVYRGVLHGNRIDGTLTWSQRNGPEQQMPWYATIVDVQSKTLSKKPPLATAETPAITQPAPPPKVPVVIRPITPPLLPADSNQNEEPSSTSGLPDSIYFCGAATCFTLQLENGRYIRPGMPDETFTIESFTKESVVLHRHDTPQKWNGFSDDVVYAGTVGTDGGSLTDTLIAGRPGEFSLRWGNRVKAPAYIALKADGDLRADLVRVPGSDLYDALWSGDTRSLMSVHNWNASPVIRIERDASFPGIIAEGQSSYITSFSASISWKGNWPWQMSFTSPVPWSTFWLAAAGGAVKNPPPLCDPNTREALDEEAIWSRVVGARIIDMRQAVCWHAVGAARNIAAFETQYAYDFLYGVGVKQDYAEARVWAEKAAAQGNENALFILADIYLEGLGVAQDPTKVRALNARRADLEIARERKLVANLSIDQALSHCVDDWGRMARTGVDCYNVIALDMHGRGQAVTGDIFRSYQSDKERCSKMTGLKRDECDRDAASLESANSVGSFFEAAALDARIASLRKLCQRYSGTTLSNGDAFDAGRCERAIRGEMQ